MIEITRIDRIGTVVSDFDRQLAILEGLFGFRAGDPIEEPGGELDRVRLSVPGSSDVDWELAAPRNERSYLYTFTQGPSGPGLHHTLFRVPDIAATAEELRRLDVEPWSDDWKTPEEPAEECFIHPRRGGHGFLFRFRESDPDEQRPPPAGDREGSMGIVAINHLSHAHARRDELSSWYERVFGMRTFHRSDEHDGRPFATHVMETPTGQMRWEVLQPTGPDSFVQRFLDQRGPAMHHVAFEVGDWERAVEACRTHGVSTFGRGEGEVDGARWVEAFIHPRDTGGILVQFFWQERPGIWV